MDGLPKFPSRRSSDFRRIVASFRSQPDVLFASVLSAERIERIFRKHDNLFGVGRIYSTAVVLWSFLRQVLRDGKESSCQATVARIVAFQQRHGAPVPTSDTRDYCRARGKLSEAALRDLSRGGAAQTQSQADPGWFWKGRQAKLIDGCTFTMPGTPANQAQYPQQKAQKPGVGFPIARSVANISLAMAAVMNLAIGPYSGKETGESALLRSMFETMAPGEIAVMDRYSCSFMMIALLFQRGVQTCARKHQLRHSNFRRGKRLSKYDHLIEWVRPPLPKWMDEETYVQILEKLELRELRYNIVVPGRH
ncbi:hypothetical protein [Schlesneria sp. T3-172]|uniref:hypothetical protein n=1 Tax=Schlesneria sphaerica TaxID=3373610 RepID=UPI0037C8C23B